MKIFNLFSKKQKVENLPDLIRKIDRNELIKYKAGKQSQVKLQDPLYMRIKIEELDYVNLYYKELPYYKKYLVYPFKKFISEINFINHYRFEKSIYRPNVDLRSAHFGVKPKKYIIPYVGRIILVFIVFYLLGYLWARLKYDTSYRRFMYCHYFSLMMMFEYVDYQAGRVLKVINEYLPKEMSDKEFEFIIYRKIRSYWAKRKIGGKVEQVLNTNPDLIEIDDIMRRVNK